MRSTLEREVKLASVEGFTLPELGGVTLPDRTFVSTYHDAPGLPLARHGITFRHRVENGTGLWQLKLPRAAARIELELPGRPGKPSAEMLALLVAHLRGTEVAPVARLRTWRETVRVDGVEVVSDTIAVLEGQHVVRRFHEVELELIDGDEEAMQHLERRLREAGASRPLAQLVPKLHQALGLPAPGVEVLPTRKTPPTEALGLELAEQRRLLLLHDPGTRLGADSEDLHQLRVATRRLRAYLRAGRPLLERAWAESLRAELGWLGQSLGPARDLDVLVELLAADAEALDIDTDAAQGLLVGLEAERATARQAAVEAMSSDRYLALLDRLDHVAEPELSGNETSLAEIARAEWRRTNRFVKSLPAEPPDAELHEARLRVKRARYAGELAAHELGGTGKRFVAAAKDVQTILGTHQDAVVAETTIRAWAEVATEHGVAAGRLVERQRERRQEARADWPAAWAKLRAAAKGL
ncbi:MAG: CYTH and CHAD domain-containing protein [Gaiellales bacterium]